MSIFDEPADATPLEPDEREGLKLAWVADRRDLNIAEASNIEAGLAWAKRQRKLDLLSEPFVRELHKRMFGEVWRWAGTYRTSARNLGVDAYLIPSDVKHLLDDAQFWVEHKTYPDDEVAARVHHRLVYVHPFPNGNGRHARMMADLLLEELDAARFTWGQCELGSAGEARKAYIEALRAADAGEYGRLLQFVRS